MPDPLLYKMPFQDSFYKPSTWARLAFFSMASPPMRRPSPDELMSCWQGWNWESLCAIHVAKICTTQPLPAYWCKWWMEPEVRGAAAFLAPEETTIGTGRWSCWWRRSSPKPGSHQRCCQQAQDTSSDSSSDSSSSGTEVPAKSRWGWFAEQRTLSWCLAQAEVEKKGQKIAVLQADFENIFTALHEGTKDLEKAERARRKDWQVDSSRMNWLELAEMTNGAWPSNGDGMGELQRL